MHIKCCVCRGMLFSTILHITGLTGVGGINNFQTTKLVQNMPYNVIM